MLRDDLPELVRRFGVLRTVVADLPHPEDDYDRWRRQWDDVVRVSAEVTALVGDEPEKHTTR